MRTRILTLMVSAIMLAPAVQMSASVSSVTTEQQSRKKTQVVVYATNMHCHSCVKKITENLSYAKGVKDLDVSLEKQRITVTYDPAKTNEKALAEIIVKLGYKAEVVDQILGAVSSTEKK